MPPQSEAPKKSPQDLLIVALDLPTHATALAMVDRLESTCSWFKVGLELYLAAGQPIIDDLRARGHSVFLDLKLHDIPNTVAGAVRSVATSGASLLTLHASGGPAMLTAAAEAADGIPNAPRLLAVTVLTSMDDRQLAATGISTPAAERVLQLGTMAMASGMDGLICSPLEVAALRSQLGAEPILVVPGIRPEGHSGDDQSRTASASATIAAGASMLVVGRPITSAPDPAAAATEILNQIRLAQQ
jgi:orotidine-5'-phosphate decarboxylase